jgi:hypothetical protein
LKTITNDFENMKQLCKLTVLGLTTVLATMGAGAGTIDLSFGNADGGGFTTYSAGQSFGTSGWTVTSGSVDLITGYWDGPGSGTPYVDSVDLDGNSPGAISSHTIDVTASTVTVTFDLSGNPDGGFPSTKDMLVDISGVVAQSAAYTVTSSNSKANMDYQSVTFTFTGVALGEQTLSFNSTDNPSSPYGPVVADVSVTGVPDGGTTLGLMGLSLTGITLLRRKLA